MTESQSEPGAAIRFDLERVESWKHVAHITVEPSHLEGVREKVARKLAKKVRMDGFRPGKVPVAVVRKQMPGAVEQDALEELIPEVYKKVLDEHEDLHPIAEPRVENLDLPEDAPLTFDLAIESRPELEITGLEAVEATRVLPPITDERVDEALENLVERHAHWHEREEGGAEEGDAALIDTVPLDEEGRPRDEEAEEDQAVQIGGEGVMPEISDALIGMHAGEETDVEVNYPVDFPNEDLRGTVRTIRIKVKDVRTKEVHELNDEFAREHSRFETLEELREDVREQLSRGMKNESDRNLRQQLVASLLKINEVPVPPSLERRYLGAILDDMMRNQPGAQELNEEQRGQLEEAYRPMAQQAVRKMILVDNLRRSLNIEISDEELDAKVAELAEEQGTTPDRLKAMLDRTGNLDRVRGDMEEDKVYAHLEEKAKITVSEEIPEPPAAAEAAEGAGGDDRTEAEGK